MSGVLHDRIGHSYEPIRLDATMREVFAGLSLVAIRHPDARTRAHIGELGAAIVSRNIEDSTIGLFNSIGFIASRLSGTVRR